MVKIRFVLPNIDKPKSWIEKLVKVIIVVFQVVRERVGSFRNPFSGGSGMVGLVTISIAFFVMFKLFNSFYGVINSSIGPYSSNSMMSVMMANLLPLMMVGVVAAVFLGMFG